MKANVWQSLIKNHHNICLSPNVDDLRGEVIVPPAKKLEDLIHLTELCVDLLQQNEEHYAEVIYIKMLLFVNEKNVFIINIKLV